ncbi:MAG: hypothetical protein JXB18_10210 [Sedimentisphaerales bacterium]|nr:hypothetical protein [Sedimentisphaerales bacterium]
MSQKSRLQNPFINRIYFHRLGPLCIVLFLLSPLAARAKLYYVSNLGDDSGNGLSPETAWKSLDRVNAGPFEPNDVIRFHRGDAWRGQLIPFGGNAAAHVTYGAYGAGQKPLLLGSISANKPQDWQQDQDNLWSTASVFPADIGNIIFNGGESVGIKKWTQNDLTQPGDYWYDPECRRVKLYCSKNPELSYTSIELALNRHIIPVSGKSYIIFEDLALRYGAAHGIGSSNTHHTMIRRCDLSYIGGGHQFTTEAGHPVRFGNAIEFWSNAHDHLVEQCRIWEIYDAALTNQNNAPNVKQYNIAYRQNLIWNCEYSFEYWNRPENSLTYNILFEHNTCVNAGHGWGHHQRPDPSGRHLCFYSSPAVAHDINLRNNIFFQALGNAFYAPDWPADSINKLNMDHNCWYQPAGTMILLKSQSFAMNEFASYQAALKKEPHSIAKDPLFMDITRQDFHLNRQSPCIDAAANTGQKTDLEGTAIPQGAAADIGAYETPQILP